MFISPVVFDAALNQIIDNADRLYICSEEPITYANAVDFALAGINIDAGSFTGPSDYYGTGSEVLGRIVIVTAVSGTGSREGSSSHIALTAGSDLLCVVSCNLEGVIVDIPVAVKDWCIVIEYAEGNCEVPADDTT